MVRYHMSPAPEETKEKPALSTLISSAEKVKAAPAAPDRTTAREM